MALNSIAAMRAYGAAMDSAGTHKNMNVLQAKKSQETQTSFADTITESIENVNKLQTQKAVATESFVSGENTSVHDLMISLQKASIAVSMTSTVRNKVLEAYKELSQVSF